MEVPRFNDPLTTALQPCDRICRVMKTFLKLRREQNILITAAPFEFTLQADAPFESRQRGKDLVLESKRAVVIQSPQGLRLCYSIHAFSVSLRYSYMVRSLYISFYFLPLRKSTTSFSNRSYAVLLQVFAPPCSFSHLSQKNLRRRLEEVV